MRALLCCTKAAAKQSQSTQTHIHKHTQAFDEAAKFLSSADAFEQYACLEPLRAAPGADVDEDDDDDDFAADGAAAANNSTVAAIAVVRKAEGPAGGSDDAGKGKGQQKAKRQGRLLLCGEFVDDAIQSGTCSFVTFAGDPGRADFAAEALLRRRGCRAAVFTPGGELPAAIANAAPDGGGGGGGSGSPAAAPAQHVRAYLGPVTALLSDPPVVALLQALRMAADAARRDRGGGGGGGNGGARSALEAAGDGDDAPRAPAARHTLLHISCGGCEW